MSVYNITVTVQSATPISVSFPSTSTGQLLIGDIINQETPTPATDGVETTFFTANAYRSGHLSVYRDQSLLIRGVDYTETDPDTGQFDLTVAPDSDENLRVDYIKQ